MTPNGLSAILAYKSALFKKPVEPEVDATGLARMQELRKVPLNAELLDMGTAKTVDDMTLQWRVLKGAHHHD
jgi:hypothetical protein